MGEAVVDDRKLAFGILRNHPRIWITTDTPEGPTLLGHLTGIVNDVPDLWICDHESWPWILNGDNATRIEEAALHIWQECLRNCDG